MKLSKPISPPIINETFPSAQVRPLKFTLVFPKVEANESELLRVFILNKPRFEEFIEDKALTRFEVTQRLNDPDDDLYKSVLWSNKLPLKKGEQVKIHNVLSRLPGPLNTFYRLPPLFFFIPDENCDHAFYAELSSVSAEPSTMKLLNRGIVTLVGQKVYFKQQVSQPESRPGF